MQNKSISVIIPTYGRSTYFKRALNSLLMQDFQDFEVIVVDDNILDSGFSQSVKSVIEEFKYKLDINYVKTEGKIGPAAARNKGIFNAQGTYVTFLDDDDLYLNSKMSVQYEDMLENNLDLSVMNLILINENGSLVEYRNHRELLNSQSNNDLMRYHLKYHLTGTSSLMIKKSVLNEVENFTEIDIGDEFYLVYKVLKKGCKVGYLDLDGVVCNIHTGNGGVSTGIEKINGINALEKFKQENFIYLNKKDIKIINVRKKISELIFLIRNKNYNFKLVLNILYFIINPVITMYLFNKYTSIFKRKKIKRVINENIRIIKLKSN